jgi:hypothetical protein
MIDGKRFSFWAYFSSSKITSSPETPELLKELMQPLLPYFDSNQERPFTTNMIHQMV